MITLYYASNVEVYLSRQQTAVFCGSLAALPCHSGAWFVGSKGMRPFPSKLEACTSGGR